MADDRMFAPLRGGGRWRQAAAPAAEPWRPILPVPDNAPPGPTRHPRRGKPAAGWTYLNPTGKLFGYILRFNQPDGSKEPDRLAQRPTASVVVCEGEKAADASSELLPDHVAVTSPNGAKSAAKADWRALAGRDVILSRITMTKVPSRKRERLARGAG